MQHELLLKAITHSTMGVLIVAVLLVLLIGLRREFHGGEPVRGLFQLSILVMGLCAFMALMAALFGAKTMVVPERISQKLDTASVSNGVLDDAHI